MSIITENKKGYGFVSSFGLMNKDESIKQLGNDTPPIFNKVWTRNWPFFWTGTRGSRNYSIEFDDDQVDVFESLRDNPNLLFDFSFMPEFFQFNGLINRGLTFDSVNYVISWDVSFDMRINREAQQQYYESKSGWHKNQFCHYSFLAANAFTSTSDGTEFLCIQPGVKETKDYKLDQLTIFAEDDRFYTLSKGKSDAIVYSVFSDLETDSGVILSPGIFYELSSPELSVKNTGRDNRVIFLYKG